MYERNYVDERVLALDDAILEFYGFKNMPRWAWSMRDFKGDYIWWLENRLNADT